MTTEEAIKRLNKIKAIYKGMDNKSDVKALDMAIKALEQEPILSISENPNKWIPCSERLPKEENKHYWICTDCGCQCECRWTNVNHIWPHLTTDWHWHNMDVPPYNKVVAWMPLPEPYKEESGDEE